MLNSVVMFDLYMFNTTIKAQVLKNGRKKSGALSMMNEFSVAALVKVVDNVPLHPSISASKGRLLAVNRLQSQTYRRVHRSFMSPSFALLLLNAAWKSMESTNHFPGC